MSYYQLISLKLQLGIDPDASFDHKTLLKMWKTHYRSEATATKPAIMRNQPLKPGSEAQHLPQDLTRILHQSALGPDVSY